MRLAIADFRSAIGRAARGSGHSVLSPQYAALVLALACLCAGAQGADLITTAAGDGSQSFGGDGGPSTLAKLNTPSGVCVDSAGNVYISDKSNNRIRKVEAASGIITTIAGDGSAAFGGDGGPATSAKLNSPEDIIVDGSGNLLICDRDNNRIRKVTMASGIITTIVGGGSVLGDGGPATCAQLSVPHGICLDSNGSLYIGDYGQHRVRKVDAATGNISTVAGVGTAGFTGDSGLATAAQLRNPWGVAVDTAGNIYISDSYNHRLRKVTASNGNISTIAGTGSTTYGGDGGLATAASFNTPTGILVDGSGNVYFGHNTDRINRIDAGTGIFTTFAGSGGTLGDGGPASSASLANNPDDVAIDPAGNFYIAHSHRVRKVGSPWIAGATTAAGVVGTAFSYTISANSASSCNATDLPLGLSVNTATGLISGTPTSVGGFLATISATNGSGANSKTLRVVIDPKYIINTVAGNGTNGSTGDGGPATSAALSNPSGVAVDASGNIYICNSGINKVRKVDAATGNISTYAGTGSSGSAGDGGAATSAQLASPEGVVLDAAGNVYIGDTGGQRIRKVLASTGVINTYAGTGASSFSGDGGPATSATFANPMGLALDGTGNLFIAVQNNQRIRKVDTGGIINTVAGGGGSLGDGGQATSATLAEPKGVAVDGAGTFYIADQNNERIRKVDGATGIITTFAGNGTASFSGDGGLAVGATLNKPNSVALDGDRSVLFADNDNQRVRKVDLLTQIITTIVGTGVAGFSGDGGIATAAQLKFTTTPRVTGVAVDAYGNVYIGDRSNHRVRKLSVSPQISSALTATGTANQAFSYTITATGSGVSFSTSTLPAGLSLNGAIISGTPTEAAIGTTNVTLTATNSIGSDNKVLALTINPPPAPVINSPTSASATEGSSFSYTITATNNPSSYGAAALPGGLSVNTTTGVISGTPGANGTFNVAISATNVGGTGNATLALTVNAVTPGAPAITSASSASGTVGAAFSYTITATNNPTSFSATNLPGGLSVNTSSGAISGTPQAAGSFSVTISATNGSGSSSTTLSLTVAEAVPAITSATSAGGTVGQAFSYTITATGNPASFAASGLPEGLSLNTTTGEVSGKPTAKGSTDVTISATNAAGAGSAMLTLSFVGADNVAPAIGSVSITVDGQAVEAVKTGTTVSFSVTASDPNGDPIRYAWDFGDGSRAAGSSATHAYSKEGPLKVTVTASDGVLTDTKTLDLRVYVPASGGSGGVNNGATVTNPLDGVTITVLSSDGGVLEMQVTLSGTAPPQYTITTQISGINGVLATITGARPVYGFVESGIYVVTATVTDANDAVIGQTRITLPIGVSETGGTGETPTPPDSLAITGGALKGKFVFNLNKPDVVSFKGTVELPGGLETARERTCWVGAGNVIDCATLDAKGKGKGKPPGVLGRMTKVQVKYPRLKKPATATSAGMPAKIAFTLSVADMDALGFSTEGITNTVLPTEKELKSVQRSIQVAVVLAGTPYRGAVPVQFKLSKKADTGQLATRRQ